VSNSKPKAGSLSVADLKLLAALTPAEQEMVLDLVSFYPAFSIAGAIERLRLSGM
jgi:hypothetical protein